MRKTVAAVLLLLGSALSSHASGPAPGTTAPRLSYDADRCSLLVNGQPFFCLGFYNVPPEQFAVCAGAGFNAVTRPGPGPYLGMHLKQLVAEHPDQVEAFLRSAADAALQAGLWDLEDPNRLTYEYFQYGDPAFPDKYARFLADPLPQIVTALRGHPAVLAFNNLDEPSTKMVPQVQAYHETVRRLDPQRAVMLNFCRNVHEAAPHCEIITADYYQHRDRDPLIHVYEQVRQNVAQARQAGRPYWHVPLAESYESVPPLRPEDQIAQTYLSVVGGASGILWWNWPPRHVATWKVLQQMAAELAALTPVLVETRNQPEVELITPETARSVVARVIQHGGVTFVIAVNAAPCPADVTFQVPTPLSRDSNVWFEDRAVSVREGRWQDHFEPKERHVYALQTTWPKNRPLRLAVSLERAPEPSPGPSVTVPGNILPDPGAEEGAEGWKRRVWVNTDRDNPARRHFLDTAERHSGRQSAALQFTAIGRCACWDSPTITLQPNTFYRLGGWAKVEVQGDGHRAMIYVVGKKGIFGNVRMETANYAGWRECRTQLRTGAKAVEVWLRCQYEAEDFATETPLPGSGKVWFDDLYIVPAPAGVTNMVGNSGFEGGEWLAGWPVGWNCSPSLFGVPGIVGGSEQLWKLDDTVAWEGTHSLRLDNPGAATALPIGPIAWSAGATYELAGVTLSAGQPYTLSAYVKADRDDCRVILVPGGTHRPVTREWTRVSLTHTPEADNTRVYVILYTDRPGTVWIDGVQFEAGETPTPYHCWAE
ncbi:MAG: hypothetical protein KKI08_05145 [Armatimonadetes bacterium]|nr:hypothetical protein [Armatimonadota bacterium]